MNKKNNSAFVVYSVEDLGHALDITQPDTIEMEFRSDITVAVVKAIQNKLLTHAQIAKRSGTSRSRVTAIAGGNTAGISTEVLVRVLAATGYRPKLTIIPISVLHKGKKAA